jgi:transposase InsO family protein
MQVWITSQEAIDALEISKQAFHKAREAGKFRYRTISSNGGTQYNVMLSDLPADAQSRYWSKKNITDDITVKQDDADIYATAPEYARKKADKYLTIINQSAGLHGDDLKRFIAQWNAETPNDTTSYPRVIDARKNYKLHGIAALLGQWGKRSGATSVNDDLFAFFKSLYLKEGRPSAQSCWKITLGYAAKNGYDTTNFPSHMAFVRRLQKEIPEQAVFTARNGAAAANKKYGYYIKRNYDDVYAGECWVSDHAQVDIAVSYTENGRLKYGFPWVTAWRDFKTGKWLGWDLHMEGPNSDHIFQAFFRAATTYGIGSYVYLDNGKDYRCKDFAGGRKIYKVQVDEKKTTSLTAALGIQVIYAWPYNAQSKTIERDFLRNKEWFSKHDSGYRGGNVVERPESLNEVIKSGNIMSFEEFEGIFSSFIIDVINQSILSTGYRENQCPNEIWDNEIQSSINSGKVKAVSKNALMLFCTRTSGIMTIGRRGIHDTTLGIDYYDNWLEGIKGKKVYLRRDPKAMQDAWVFDAKTNDYLGQVYLNKETPALADKSEIGKAELQKQIAIKRASNKIHRSFATADIDNMTTTQKLNLMAGAAKILNDTRGYVPSNHNVCFPSVESTQMDSVLARKKEIEKEGLQDFSILGLHKQKKEEKKRKLIIFESDRDIAANS